jgi:hypothetical protein
MAHSGHYKVANPAKYKGDFTNVVYRSLWELYCFQWCDTSSSVKEWVSEEIVIPYFYEVDKKYHRYFIDLKITLTDNTVILVEIKPEKETAAPKRPDKSKRYITEALTDVNGKRQNSLQKIVVGSFRSGLRRLLWGWESCLPTQTRQ